MKKLVDPESWELAEYFLTDYTHTQQHVEDLAGAIQQAVEDYFLMHDKELLEIDRSKKQ
jgi:hypothetical protein